jgi:hypothetical protein
MRYVEYSDRARLVWDNKSSEWIILRPFTVYWNRPGKHLEFTVQEGFTTDLASIPRVFQSITPTVGHHIQPSIVHDWCYEANVPGLTRKDADLLFLDGMKDAGVYWLRRHVMYRAVRLFGGSLWD